MSCHSHDVIERAEKWGAHNYHPLAVVLAKAEGPFVWDVEGRRYLDMLSCYSALSHGHRNPRIIAACERQMKEITLTSRAFYNEPYAEFCEMLAKLAGLDMVLPMNSGAEAVETALKIARAWGYRVKHVPANKAHILTAAGNFHGRTLAIVSFSTEAAYRDPFGPATPGFGTVPYGDLAALEKAITPETVAFMVEPIQGEGGIIVPPEGYLKGVIEICHRHNVLAMFDEVQTGLARTGRMFAFEYENARPDILILGKALGGGLLPVSACVGTKAVMEVLQPGEHGSTFGGMPLSMTVGIEALKILVEDKLSERSLEMGNYAMNRLRKAGLPGVREVRGKGLLIGVEFEEFIGGALNVCAELVKLGVLAKDTRQDTLRLAPALTIDKTALDEGLQAVETAVRKVAAERRS